MWNMDSVTLAMKAIGEIESNLVYDAINYNDPITVGVAQWYGTRAASILNEMREAHSSQWNNVVDPIKTDIETRSATANYWNSRYLSPAEGNSLKPLLQAAKDVQNARFAADIEDYVQVLDNIGFDKDGATDAAIFFCTMYHQAPQAALQVVNRVGLSPTLTQIYNGALNHSVLGRYRSRQREARDIIIAGDTTGIDDIPGDPGEDGGTDPDIPSGRLRGNIRQVRLVGDHLHIKLTTGGTITAYAATANTWIPGVDPDTGAPEDPPDDNPNPPGGTETQQALVTWMTDREGAFRYSQGPDRNDPDRTGAGDCSSVVRQAYLDVMGIDIGSNTVAQYNNGTRIQSGVQGQDYPDTNLIQPGDLLYTLTGWSGRNSVDHVEMIMNSTQTIGHAGNPPMGPAVWPLNDQLNWAVSGAMWYIQRHVSGT